MIVRKKRTDCLGGIKYQDRMDDNRHSTWFGWDAGKRGARGVRSEKISEMTGDGEWGKIRNGAPNAK